MSRNGRVQRPPVAHDADAAALLDDEQPAARRRGGCVTYTGESNEPIRVSFTPRAAALAPGGAVASVTSGGGELPQAAGATSSEQATRA